jgi:tetratricopeptide (TPR) repeat protein
MKTGLLLGLVCVFGATQALAEVSDEVHQFQTRWAQVNYELEGDAQLEAFEKLAAEAGSYAEAHADDAGAWIWSGIIKSTYAGAKGGLGALGLAKESKRDLERAMEIDADALDGSAYASLGTLYYSVPGWPVGFGDDDKAEELLQKALNLSPEAIDNNYFYASYLVSRKRYDEARDYFERARHAPARPDRPLADSGRQEEIRLALEAIQGK